MCTLTLLLIHTSCLEIDVDSELMPQIPAIPDPAPDAPLVQLRVGGERMDDASWAKALTISRFFFSSVENRSGSPRDLLAPGLREILRQGGYRTAPGFLPDDREAAAGENPESESQSESLVLDVFAERNQLLWLPPREFIQTPKARARGTVRVDVIIHTRLLRTHAASASQEELWSAEFREDEELRVLPGEEGPGLATGARLAFQNYLRRLQIDLPPARSQN
ncbi:MAG: hypothetical protein NXI24_07255 [bacterium]|nr:hypothetical protein [bacterium]